MSYPNLIFIIVTLPTVYLDCNEIKRIILYAVLRNWSPEKSEVCQNVNFNEKVVYILVSFPIVGCQAGRKTKYCLYKL